MAFRQLGCIALAALFLAGVAQSSTTYGCYNSDSGNEFRASCVKAFTSLVMQQTGIDSNAFIPASTIVFASGNCQAQITGSGNGNVVRALNLIASFDQLGSRCQNGYFYYDEGWLHAQIQGHAGWRRLQAVKPQATSTERYLLDQSLRKRTAAPTENATFGTFIARMTVGLRSYALWRADQMTVHELVPNQGNEAFLLESIIVSAGSMLDGVLTATGNDVIQTSFTIPHNLTDDNSTGGNSTDDVVAIAVQTKFASWEAMFNYIGGETYNIHELFLVAIGDFWNQTMLAGDYNIFDENGLLPICSFIINGVAGQTSPFPSN